MGRRSDRPEFTTRQPGRRFAVAILGVALSLPLTASAQSAALNFKHEPLVIVKNGRYGYINHHGKIVIQPAYLWSSEFEEGFATAYVCGKLVSMEESGKLVPLRHANAGRLAPASKNGKFGFIGVTGSFKISPIFDDALPFSDGLASVQFGKLWGFIDTSGHFVIPPKFKSAFYFIEGVATAENRAGYVLIDRNGAVLATGFDLAHGIPQDGRIPVGRNAKYGYLGLRGNIAIPLVYDDVTTFSEGLAAVEKGRKWGYITTAGQTAIPFKFDYAGPFASGLAPVKVGKDSGFINRTGKFAFHLSFDYAPGFLTGNDNGLLVANYDVSRFWTKNGAFGYVNTSEKVIWGPAAGSPDHPPVTGWSKEDKIRSCDGMPKRVRNEVAKFPVN